ncbi:MAG: hypothetical protein JXC36_07780 [Candidatus Atribacteria bacterium]|nr:hypothetical protein [Candidatus Atribacteria bacterium]MBN2747640.1 hypothetical protein [Bacteroidales bacterium]
MSIEELSQKLKEMYEYAPKNEQVANIHLFGIEFGEIIQRNNYRVSQIILMAEMKRSYCIELSKGIKLSKFVKLKSSINI